MFDYIGLVIVFGLFFITPILVPLFMKKWVWLIVVVCGYLLYIVWGVYLHFSADIKEYGTGYGMLVLPYVFFIFILGFFIQKGLMKKEI